MVRPSGWCLWHKGLVEGSCGICLQEGFYLLPGWSCACLCLLGTGWIRIFADGAHQSQLRCWLGEGSEQVGSDERDLTRGRQGVVSGHCSWGQALRWKWVQALYGCETLIGFSLALGQCPTKSISRSSGKGLLTSAGEVGLQHGTASWTGQRRRC